MAYLFYVIAMLASDQHDDEDILLGKSNRLYSFRMGFRAHVLQSYILKSGCLKLSPFI